MKTMISREQFCTVFDSDFVDRLIDLVMDAMGHIIQTERFIVWYDMDFEEFNIVLKDGLDVRINWYKLYHVGRALELKGISGLRTLRHYRDMLAEDINYEKKNNKKDK